MGRAADLYARVSPHLAHRPGSALPTRLHAWLLRRTGGRLGRRFLGIPVLVLRTTGRRSGEPRESPMFFLAHRDGWAVMAANAASKRPPAWFLNLEAEPDAEALRGGAEFGPVAAPVQVAAEPGAAIALGRHDAFEARGHGRAKAEPRPRAIDL